MVDEVTELVPVVVRYELPVTGCDSQRDNKKQK
jgi:hypothetical protein